MSRRKYSPITAACLTRLEGLIETNECDYCEGYTLFNGERVFTTHELAYVCGVTPTTISNFVREGRLVATNIAGVTRFLEKDIKKFIGAAPEERFYEVA
jgi:hypothetical protein